MYYSSLVWSYDDHFNPEFDMRLLVLFFDIQTEFNMEEILRKYIRYALNEKPFNPDLVADLIHLRRASDLNDSQIPEILNEISRRIVKEKGNYASL